MNRPDVWGDRLSHAYLVISQSEKVREGKSRQLAAAMLCQAPDRRPCGVCRDCRKVMEGLHPDVIIAGRQRDDSGKARREIYVDQIRDIAADSVVLPNEAAKKVYIIRDAGAMNQAAQNALLKLLEEPPEHVCFILCTGNAGTLLDTVRSRCVEIYENTESEAEPDSEYAVLAEEFLKNAALGDRAEMLRFCENRGKLTPDGALEFVRAVWELAAEILAGRKMCPGLSRRRASGIIALMERAEEYLRVNVNVRHVLGMLAVCTIDLE